MNWTELLTAKLKETYHATDGLVAMCDDRSLAWKPATGANWMTTGQLLKHIESACGMCFAGFVTGEWPMPADAKPEDMLPKAEKMASTSSVAATKAALAADRKLAIDMLKRAGEADLSSKKVAAPWNPTPQLLGVQLLGMIEHLANHKAQLFYYLKLQGKPVHTGTLYGM